MRRPAHVSPKSRKARPSRYFVIPLAAVLVLLVAVAAGVVRTRISDGAEDWRPRSAVLTPDGKDIYVAKTAPAAMRITAPATNTDGNLRVIYHREGVAPATDGESCANWTDDQGIDAQQGVALRIRADGQGNTQAITVTKNIFGASVWEFNVHLWISGRTLVENPVAKFNLYSSLIPPEGGLYPLPWRMCARALGTAVDVKVWPTSRPEPAWDDPRSSGSVTVPRDWVYPGSAGWYIGHLQPGHHATFTKLGTWKYPAADSSAGGAG